MSSSGIDFSKVPTLADPDTVNTHAGTIRTQGKAVETVSDEIDGKWKGLSESYDAPESPTVLAALNPNASTASGITTDAGTVATALEAYAETERDLKTRLTTLKTDVSSFESSISGDDEWEKDEDKVKQRDGLVDKLNGIISEHQVAEQTCANAINAVYGGTKYVSVNADGSPPPPGTEYYAMDKDILNSAVAAGEAPWASNVEWDKPWYRDALDGIASFGSGLWEGLKGTVTGLVAMVNPFDWETFSSTWKGIGTLALDVATVTMPVVALVRGKDAVAESGNRLVEVGKSLINLEEWKNNPAKAAGMLTADVLLTVATGGAGAVAKGLSAAGKAGKAASAAGKAGKLGGLGKFTVKAGDLAERMAGAGKIKLEKLDLGIKDLGVKIKYGAADKAMDAVEKAIPKYHAARETIGRYSAHATEAAQRVKGAGQNALDHVQASGRYAADRMLPGERALAPAGGPVGGRSNYDTVLNEVRDSRPKPSGGSSHGSPDLGTPEAPKPKTLDLNPPKKLQDPIDRSKYRDSEAGQAKYEEAVQKRERALVQYEAKAQHLQDTAKDPSKGLMYTEPARGSKTTRASILRDIGERRQVELPAGLKDDPEFKKLQDPSTTVAEAKKILQGYDFDHKTELQLGGADSVKNGQWLDSRVNRSSGSQIRWQLLKHQLADSSFTKGGHGEGPGSRIDDVTFNGASDGLRSPVTIPPTP